MTTVPNQFNASQLEISTCALNGNVISGSITSGDLGGLLAARTQVINPALNQLGQVATALSQTVNSQQALGLDLNGKVRRGYSRSAHRRRRHPRRTPTARRPGVSVTGVGALTANDYVLSNNAGAHSLTRLSDGSRVPLTGTGTAGNPLTADGFRSCCREPPRRATNS